MSRQPKDVRIIIQAFHENVDILEIVVVCVVFPSTYGYRDKLRKIEMRAANVLLQVEDIILLED